MDTGAANGLPNCMLLDVCIVTSPLFKCHLLRGYAQSVYDMQALEN